MNTMRDRKAIAKAKEKQDAYEATLPIEERIRLAHRRGDGTKKELAKQFGVPTSEVRFAISPHKRKTDDQNQKEKA